MKAVHIEDGRVTVVERARPEAGEGEALLRLICGGICNTDLELMRGYYGFAGTPGHEFVAEVVEAPEERWVGRRVTGEINVSCRKCSVCRAGKRRHCPLRTVLGIVKKPGAFSEYFTIPVENIHSIADEVKTEHAVFTEPVAAACEILDQVTVKRGTRVAVLGDGKLGLLVGQVLHLHGARVRVYGRHREKLAVAEEAGMAVDFGNKSKRAAYPVVVEATGTVEGLTQAIGMVEPLGTIVLKSTTHKPATFDAARVVVDEITIVGSRCGRFEPAMKLIESGKLKLDSMIEGRYGLGEAVAAFERAGQRGAKKVLLWRE